MSKSIGFYKTENPERHNFWVERFRSDYHQVRRYTPTKASRARIMRIIKSLEKFEAQRYFVFLKMGV